jgi:hypothetical protein
MEDSYKNGSTHLQPPCFQKQRAPNRCSRYSKLRLGPTRLNVRLQDSEKISTRLCDRDPVSRTGVQRWQRWLVVLVRVRAAQIGSKMRNGRI